MAEEVKGLLFTVTTKMEMEDLRKFFSIATFQRSPYVMPMLVAIAFIAAVFSWRVCGFDGYLSLVLLWLFFGAAAVGAVLFQVERKNKKLLDSDLAAAYQRPLTLNFYADEMIVPGREAGSYSRQSYDDLHQVLAAREYLILFYKANLAGVIRKADAADPAGLEEFLRQKVGKRFRRIR